MAYANERNDTQQHENIYHPISFIHIQASQVFLICIVHSSQINSLRIILVLWFVEAAKKKQRTNDLLHSLNLNVRQLIHEGNKYWTESRIQCDHVSCGMSIHTDAWKLQSLNADEGSQKASALKFENGVGWEGAKIWHISGMIKYNGLNTQYSRNQRAQN